MIIRDLHQPLAAALQLMIERPKALQPFVVVDVVRKETFVQFCGSAEEPMRFEFPESGMVVIFRPGTAYLSDVAAAFAVKFLTGNLSLDMDTEVQIQENPTRELTN